ncbi:MAG TPA: hypothetical protein VMS31_01020 [Pyrinomonadaceae bacterium]|nr:hypothetical protein [Pyrinomonadaceae bacterium]
MSDALQIVDNSQERIATMSIARITVAIRGKQRGKRQISQGE